MSLGGSQTTTHSSPSVLSTIPINPTTSGEISSITLRRIFLRNAGTFLCSSTHNSATSCRSIVLLVVSIGEFMLRALPTICNPGPQNYQKSCLCGKARIIPKFIQDLRHARGQSPLIIPCTRGVPHFGVFVVFL